LLVCAASDPAAKKNSKFRAHEDTSAHWVSAPDRAIGSFPSHRPADQFAIAFGPQCGNSAAELIDVANLMIPISRRRNAIFRRSACRCFFGIDARMKQPRPEANEDDKQHHA
jgi:hypothetical protein